VRSHCGNRTSSHRAITRAPNVHASSLSRPQNGTSVLGPEIGRLRDEPSQIARSGVLTRTPNGSSPRQQALCVVIVTRFGTGDRATTSRHSLPAHVSIEYQAAMAPRVERSAELNVASCELGKSSIDFEKSPELYASTVAWL